MSSPWTDKLEDTLRTLWAAGKTGGQIALLMSGFSRSAVLAHARSMGLERRGPDSPMKGVKRGGTPRAKPQSSKPKRRRAVVVHAPRAIPVIIVPELIPYKPNPTPLLYAEPNQCRNIDGEPVPNAVVCGGIVKPGYSFCPYHHSRLFYQKPVLSTYRPCRVAA